MKKTKKLADLQDSRTGLWQPKRNSFFRILNNVFLMNTNKEMDLLVFPGGVMVIYTNIILVYSMGINLSKDMDIGSLWEQTELVALLTEFVF